MSGLSWLGRPARIFILKTRAGRASHLWLALPLLLGLAWVMPDVWSMLRTRLDAAYPLSPWESMTVVDAWRVNRGETVYQMPADGPAAFMYGPLSIWANAAAFALVGPNLQTPRLISAAAAVLTAGLLGFAFMRRSGIAVGAVAFLLVAVQFYRAREAFAESRPDAASILFETAALLLLYAGHRRAGGEAAWRGWAYTAAGSAACVVGFFFKQPAAAAAAVPAVALLVGGGRVPRREWLRAGVPLMAVAAALLMVYVLWPVGWFYMVSVPAMYGYDGGRAWGAALGLARWNTLFLLIFGAFVAERVRGVGRKDQAVVWSLAAVAALAAAGVPAYAKAGGTVNSLLPSFVAMSAFTCAALPAVAARLARRRWALRVAAAAVLGVAVVSDATTVDGSGMKYAERRRDGDAGWADLVGYVAATPGQTVCPDDPTIPLFANGYAGRTLMVERDARGWPDALPAAVVAEIGSADRVIRVAGPWTAVSREQMRRLGFRLLRTPATRSDTYDFFRKERPR